MFLEMAIKISFWCLTLKFEILFDFVSLKGYLLIEKLVVMFRAFGRSENPGVPVVIRWA